MMETPLDDDHRGRRSPDPPAADGDHVRRLPFFRMQNISSVASDFCVSATWPCGPQRVTVSISTPHHYHGQDQEAGRERSVSAAVFRHPGVC